MDKCCENCEKSRRWLVIQSDDANVSVGSFLDDPVFKIHKKNNDESCLAIIDRSIDPLFTDNEKKTQNIHNAIGECAWNKLASQILQNVVTIDEFMKYLDSYVVVEKLLTESQKYFHGFRTRVGYICPWTEPMSLEFDPKTRENYAVCNMGFPFQFTGDILDCTEIIMPAFTAVNDECLEVTLFMGDNIFQRQRFVLEEVDEERFYIARFFSKPFPAVAMPYMKFMINFRFPLTRNIVPMLPPAVRIQSYVTFMPMKERKCMAKTNFMLMSPADNSAYMVSCGIMCKAVEPITTISVNEEELAIIDGDPKELESELKLIK